MPEQIRFFTICARNYLAMAAALGESLARHHPQARYTVFVLDFGEVPDSVAHLHLRPIQHVVPEEEYARRCCYYDLLELSTSVKARCFAKLFAEGGQFVVYLDPDIYLLRPLSEAHAALLDGAAGVLLPHILSPLPDDGATPDDLDILRSGVYNLGFLALASGQETSRFLQWWDDKLQWQCFRDPREGVFTDQRWMDFAPAFLPNMRILADATYDVAYWNLHERRLSRTDDGTWLVNGAPLSFFHFSGFDPFRPRRLSKHQDRFREVDAPLSDLLAFYSSRVLASGHAELTHFGFPEIRFKNGAAWDPICRVLYRWKIESGDVDIHPLEDGSFLSWMGSFGPGQSVPRYIQVLFQLRPDVAAAYPQVPGRDWDNLLVWLTRSGGPELGIDRTLLIALGIIKAKSSVPKVVYVGYLHSHLGVGEAARGYIRALASAAVSLSLVDVSKESRNDTGDYDIVQTFGVGGTPPDPDVAIIHVNADQLPFIHDKYLSSLPARRRVGFWAWETLDFPDQWTDRFNMVDEVWVPSQFVASAVSAKAPCPVVVVPHVIDVPAARSDRASFGLCENEFVFLMQFDFRSVAMRKNPEGTIRAFTQAFLGGEPVKLIVKTMNGDREPGKLARLEAIAGDPRIVFLDGAMDDGRRYDLLAAADCYVSLHRSEGFGLSLAESMAYGKPVIATGWGGNLEYMTIANSILLSYTLKPLAFSESVYPAGTLWAEPDIESAVRAMRRVFSDRAWAHGIGARAKSDMAERFSPAAIGKLMKGRLELLSSQATHGAQAPGQAPVARGRIQTFFRHPRKELKRLSAAWARS